MKPSQISRVVNVVTIHAPVITLPCTTRRAALIGLGAIASSAISGCGGGGSGESIPTATSTPAAPSTPANPITTPPVPAKLTATTFPASTTTARVELTNRFGGNIAAWVDPSTNQLTQTRYIDGKGASIRVYYGATQEVTRIVDESSKTFIAVTPISSDRTDYNLYDIGGEWKFGWAVIKNADGSYSTAQILTSANLQGNQITGDLTGIVTASYSLIPDGQGGLGPLKRISTIPLLFTQVNPAKRGTHPLDRLTDMLFSRAYAQKVTSSQYAQLIKGAYIGAVGGLLLTQQGIGTVVALAPFLGAAAPMVGAAVIGYGVYQIGKGLIDIQSAGLRDLDDASNKIFDSSLKSFSEGGDALETLRTNSDSYFQKGASALPALSGIQAGLQNTASNAVSSLVQVSTAAWQAIKSAAPAGVTGLKGLLVDTTGTSFPLNGTYSGADGTVSFDSGTTTAGRINASGKLSAQSGVYSRTTTVGGMSTGSMTVKSAVLGACQTQQSSGGQGTFSKSYDLGKDAGEFKLEYEMYTVKDALEIRSAAGNVLYTTGGLVSGGKTVQVPYSGGRFIFVVVSAPTAGTKWDYSIGCPA